VTDEQQEWVIFAMRYAEPGHRCLPCASQNAVRAWARGEHDHRPPDVTLRGAIMDGLEAQRNYMEAEDELAAVRFERREREMARIRAARDVRRRQDPDRPT